MNFLIKQLYVISQCQRPLKKLQTSGLKNQSLDLTLSDYPAENPEYVQNTAAGHILFRF